MPVRDAKTDELGLLRDIQLAAGAMFAYIGMAEIAANDPTSVEELLDLRNRGFLLVDVDEHDRPVAFLAARSIDMGVHIDQVSVFPAVARRRIGSGLIDYLALRVGRPLTLTTFTDVPWNAPYYTRCGFRVLAGTELSADLAAICAEEALHLPARWPRVAMCRGSRTGMGRVSGAC